MTKRITKTYQVQTPAEAAAICSMLDAQFGSTWFTNRETDVLVHVLDKHEDQLDKEVALCLDRLRNPIRVGSSPVHVLDKHEDRLDKKVALCLDRTHHHQPSDLVGSFLIYALEGSGIAALAIGWMILVLSLFA